MNKSTTIQNNQSYGYKNSYKHFGKYLGKYLGKYFDTYFRTYNIVGIVGLLGCMLVLFSLLTPFSRIAAASPLEHTATKVVTRLHDKVADESLTYQIRFYNRVISVLDDNRGKHPVIPVLIDQLETKKANLMPGNEVVADINTTIDAEADVTGPSLPYVDMERVRTTRLGWVNDERAKRGLDPYVLDTRLDATAQEWANTLSTKWPTLKWERPQGGTHWRNSASEGYYNYEVITQWFAERGISPTPTENVFYRGYSCSSGDCTDSLLASMRKGFDFFLNEGPGGAHHDTQMSPFNTKFGMGLAHERGFKIWAVFHVGK